MKNAVSDELFRLELRSVTQTKNEDPKRELSSQQWDPTESAIIICDVWDYHHSINAVKRLEQFAPRLNALVTQARKQGAIIIHAPSDCMASYSEHPGRARAIECLAKHRESVPKDTEKWCSKIVSEVKAKYPIDQSDGGEDDDRDEHAKWAKQLQELGRNPSMPWKQQLETIEIDSDNDFISDKGDEVWAVLHDRKLKNVILTGVHTNMCVTGRPFGIRQMVRNGFRVALVRDLTDCMYNPVQWPYVDHFTGNDLLIAYVEQYLCPTITSNQILGGDVFRFKEDKRVDLDIVSMRINQPIHSDDFVIRWLPVRIPGDWEAITHSGMKENKKVTWYRCAVRLDSPDSLVNDSQNADLPKLKIQYELELPAGLNGINAKAWLNGRPLPLPIRKTQVSTTGGEKRWTIPTDAIQAGEANLLVLRIDHQLVETMQSAPVLVGIHPSREESKATLDGTWQMRIGEDLGWSNIPLPAKFGISPEIYHEINFSND